MEGKIPPESGSDGTEDSHEDSEGQDKDSETNNLGERSSSKDRYSEILHCCVQDYYHK